MNYLIMAFDRTHPGHPITWWRGNEFGYTTNLEHAGIFHKTTIDRNPERYNNEDTKAIKTEIINTGHAAAGIVENKGFYIGNDDIKTKPVIYCTGRNLELLGIREEYEEHYRKTRRK